MFQRRECVNVLRNERESVVVSGQRRAGLRFSLASFPGSSGPSYTVYGVLLFWVLVWLELLEKGPQ